MMGTDRMTTADGLRALADWLDAHPGIERSAGPARLDLWPDNDVTRATMVKALKAGAGIGQVRKHDYDSVLTVRRLFGDHVQLDVNLLRNQVCEQVVVGTETVQIPDPEFRAPLVERVREVTEWRCKPILAGIDEATA